MHIGATRVMWIDCAGHFPRERAESIQLTAIYPSPYDQIVLCVARTNDHNRDACVVQSQGQRTSKSRSPEQSLLGASTCLSLRHRNIQPMYKAKQYERWVNSRMQDLIEMN